MFYSEHALNRLEERGIDKLNYLPPKAKFIKNRKSKFEHGFLFKYQQDKKDVCIVISSSGVVLTVYWDLYSANYANFGTIRNKKGFEYQLNRLQAHFLNQDGTKPVRNHNDLISNIVDKYLNLFYPRFRMLGQIAQKCNESQDFQKKYLKYKNKYLQLKNNF